MGHVYNITGIVGATVHTIRSRVGILSWKMDSKIMLDKVSPLILRCFEDIESYCDERVAQLNVDKLHFKHSYFAVQDYDYKSVIDVVRSHRHNFNADPHAYIDQYIVGLPKQAANFWISQEIKYKRKLGKRVELFSDRLISGALSMFNQSRAKLYRHKKKLFVDSTELATFDLNIYQYKVKQNPFYLWAHFLDTHIPYCPGQLPNWPKNARHYLRNTGYADDLDLSAVCDKFPLSNDADVVWVRLMIALSIIRMSRLGAL